MDERQVAKDPIDMRTPRCFSSRVKITKFNVFFFFKSNLFEIDFISKFSYTTSGF